MRSVLKELNEIGIALSSESDINRLLELILQKAKALSHADNGTLYLLTPDNRLKFALIQSTSLKINMGGTTGIPIPMAPVKMYDKQGVPNDKRLVVSAALHKESINVRNIYETSDFDFSGTKSFDKLKNYRSISVLVVPLKNHENEVLGVLHLVNAQNTQGEVIPFSKEIQHFVESLASQAAISIEKQRLINEQRSLLDGMIKMIALAIDAKSPHTSNHCQAIPVLTEMLARAACKQQEGYFQHFNLNDDEWYELKVASWLHDCGKLTTPLSILEKSTKLQMVYDGIEHIRTRMELLARDAEIDYLKGKITRKEYKSKQTQYKNDFRFLKTLNKGSENISDARITHLQHIASYTFKYRLSSDTSHHPFLSKQELMNLSIRQGTLNAEERRIINNHMQVTIDMLNSLPLPKYLRRVPEYAGGHHEKMDGSGFPKGLTREDMSIPARMMAIADIFEALTAHDRPYKKPKTLSQSLAIMEKMKENHHIDPDIFDLFIKEKIYLKYAKKFLRKSQIDVG